MGRFVKLICDILEPCFLLSEEYLNQILAFIAFNIMWNMKNPKCECSHILHELIYSPHISR